MFAKFSSKYPFPRFRQWIQAAVLIGTATLVFVPFSRPPYDRSCVSGETPMEVRGQSMDPLIPNGRTVSVIVGYYGCNPLVRGDTVAYRYAGNENPIVKRAVGIEGDAFALSDAGRGEWHVLINGAPATNSSGVPYRISRKSHDLLSLYVRDYGGKIPHDALFLLGEKTGGTLDSTRFGFVSKRDLLGKVALPPEGR